MLIMVLILQSYDHDNNTCNTSVLWYARIRNLFKTAVNCQALAFLAPVLITCSCSALYTLFAKRNGGRLNPTAACTSQEQAVAVSTETQSALCPDNAAVDHSVVRSRMAGLW